MRAVMVHIKLGQGQEQGLMMIMVVMKSRTPVLVKSKIIKRVTSAALQASFLPSTYGTQQR
jgi:hypothetical protein